MEEHQVRKAEEMRRYTLDYQIEILNSWYKNFFCIDKGCHTALFKKIIFFHVITPLSKDDNDRINGKSTVKLSNAYVTNNIYSKNIGNMNTYCF